MTFTELAKKIDIKSDILNHKDFAPDSDKMSDLELRKHYILNKLAIVFHTLPSLETEVNFEF